MDLEILPGPIILAMTLELPGKQRKEKINSSVIINRFGQGRFSRPIQKNK